MVSARRGVAGQWVSGAMCVDSSVCVCVCVCKTHVRGYPWMKCPWKNIQETA